MENFDSRIWLQVHRIYQAKLTRQGVGLTHSREAYAGVWSIKSNIISSD